MEKEETSTGTITITINRIGNESSFSMNVDNILLIDLIESARLLLNAYSENVHKKEEDSKPESLPAGPEEKELRE